MLDVGQSYRASLRCVDPATGQLVNPSTATLTVTKPAQTTATVPVPRPPAVLGLLVGDYVLSQEGLHKFTWVITGPTLTKIDYENARGYIAAVSLADAKDWLNVTDTSKDEKIRSMIA